MTIARDWLNTLWPASYKGVPFHVESDTEKGGRRKAVHKYPGRDDPFIEDMGEDQRDFNVTAYVASDAADADAATVIATCAQPGAGTLVLPAHGPISVQCFTFERKREKDKHGYIALDLYFVRDGAATSQPSTLSPANLVGIGAVAVESSIADLCVAGIAATGQAD